jgi:Uma2 family endonuclease
VEVLSDSTRRKDMVVKLKKYMEAGVQVYWMVDLKKRKLIAYDFLDELIPVIHGLEGKIPLKLYEKECEIDFDRIMDYLGDLLEK